MAKPAGSEWTKGFFLWVDALEKALAAGRFSTAAFSLAIIIGRKINRQTGDAWPSEATLAKSLRKTERTISKLVKELEAAGLLLVERPGANKPNRYRMPSSIVIADLTERKSFSGPVSEPTGNTLPAQDRQYGGDRSEIQRRGTGNFERTDRKAASSEPLEKPLEEPQDVESGDEAPVEEDELSNRIWEESTGYGRRL